MVIINPEGTVLVKVDGIIYKVTSETFQQIKNIIFDLDVPVIKPICKHCKKNCLSCRANNRTIEDTNITAGLVMERTRKPKVMVFECKGFEPERVFSPYRVSIVDSSKTEEEQEMARYCSSFQAHIAHPRVLRLMQ